MKARSKKTAAAKRQTSKSETISLTGANTLATAALLKDKILRAFSQGRDVMVEASAATSADVGTLQVLVAAQKMADSSGRSLSISASSDSPIVKMMAATGFLNSSLAPQVPEISAWTISGAPRA